VLEGVEMLIDKRGHRNLELLIGRPVRCSQALNLKLKFLVLECIRFLKGLYVRSGSLEIGHHPLQLLDLSQATINLQVCDHLLLRLQVLTLILQQPPRQMIPEHLNVQVFVYNEGEETNLLFDCLLYRASHGLSSTFPQDSICVAGQDLS
jgi:hypothetical protein